MAELKSNISCRICLQCDLDQTNKYLSIFEIYNGYSILEKVNSIANVNIEEGDGFPNKICPECLLQLENAVSFKRRCEASNKILWCNLYLSLQSTQQKLQVCKQMTKEEPVKEEVVQIEVSPDPGDYCIEYSDTEDVLNTDNVENKEQNAPIKKSKAIDLNLICDDCNGTFKSKCKLRVHWKKVHQPEKLICPNCKRSFKSFKAFNIHIKSNSRNCYAATKVRIEGQGKSRVFHCKDCNYKSKRIKDIDMHSARHTGDRRFKCKDCTKCFTQHASLQAHRESMHKEYRIDTTCHLCGKHLLGRTRYYKHMRLHNNEGAQCKICNKLFKSKKYLSNHMLRHTGVKSFSCEVCAASFYTYCEVYNHRKKVHMKTRDIKCDQCDYKVCTKTALKTHKSKHTGTNVICLYCGQFSENEEKLAIHQKRHLERDVQCPQCDKTYHNKRSLNKHMCKHHKCKMLIQKREDVKLKYPIIKEESPSLKKDEIIILI